MVPNCAKRLVSSLSWSALKECLKSKLVLRKLFTWKKTSNHLFRTLNQFFNASFTKKNLSALKKVCQSLKTVNKGLPKGKNLSLEYFKI